MMTVVIIRKIKVTRNLERSNQQKETQFEFLNPVDDTDATQDEDGDGFQNLEEYRAGTDPGDPGSKPRQVTIIPIIAPLLLP